MVCVMEFTASTGISKRPLIPNRFSREYKAILFPYQGITRFHFDATTRNKGFSCTNLASVCVVSSLTFDLSAFLCDVGRFKVAQILRVSEA